MNTDWTNLRQIADYLLYNHPRLWTARFHILLLVSGFLVVTFLVLGVSIPISQVNFKAAFHVAMLFFGFLSVVWLVDQARHYQLAPFRYCFADSGNYALAILCLLLMNAALLFFGVALEARLEMDGGYCRRAFFWYFLLLASFGLAVNSLPAVGVLALICSIGVIIASWMASVFLTMFLGYSGVILLPFVYVLCLSVSCLGFFAKQRVLTLEIAVMVVAIGIPFMPSFVEFVPTSGRFEGQYHSAVVGILWALGVSPFFQVLLNRIRALPKTA